MWSSIFQRKADEAFREAIDAGDRQQRARLLEAAQYHLRMAHWPAPAVAPGPDADATPSADLWRSRASELYRKSLTADCPAERVSALLAAADCLGETVIAEADQAPAPSAQIIPFPRRRA